MTAKKNIGILQAALRLEASQFRKELKGTGGRWMDFAKKWAVPAAMIGAGVAGMKKAIDGLLATFKLVREEMIAIEEVGRAADRFGMAVEGLHALQLAADDSGVAVAAFNTSFQRMSRKIGDAIRGIPEAVKLFEQLRLDPRFLADRKPVEQLQLVADAIRRVGDEQAQLSATVKMFDSEGSVLLAWFRDVNWELMAQQKLYKDLGIAMDQDAYETAKKVNGELAMMEKAWASFRRDIAVAIAGTEDLSGAGATVAFYLGAVRDALADIVGWFRELGKWEPFIGGTIRMLDQLRFQGRRFQSESEIGARLDRELLNRQAGGERNEKILEEIREQQKEFQRKESGSSSDRNALLQGLVRLAGAPSAVLRW